MSPSPSDLRGDLPSGLTALLQPRSILLVGASRTPGKLGYGAARNLVRSGFDGQIYFVNPSGGTLFERPIYRTIEEVPSPIDLAVLLVAPHITPDTLEACGRAGVQTAIIASGGYREVGPEGLALEQRCVDVARSHGMRILGPNCIGVVDTIRPYDTTFLASSKPPRGPVAFLSQSGAICAALLDWAVSWRIGISRLISLGNQSDLCESDLLPILADDPDTAVILLYLEDLRRGRRLVEALAYAARSKPVLVLKVGRTAEGSRAAASHTGALAGLEAGVEATVRRSGVRRIETTGRLFDAARILSWCPRPLGPGVAILTNAGGPAVAAFDAMEGTGLRPATLSPQTQSLLREILPPAASVVNPVDMLATATPDQYADCLRVLLDDPGVFSVVTIVPPPPTCTADEIVEAIVPVIYSASKPVLVVLNGGPLLESAAKRLRDGQVPDYTFPEDAIAALALLAQAQPTVYETPSFGAALADVDPDRVEDLLRSAHAETGLVDPFAALELARMAGVPVSPAELVDSPEAAAQAAERIGFPVALKVSSTALSHKSDVGGVVLGLDDLPSVRRTARDLLERFREFATGSDTTRLLVQRMAPEGQELVVGTLRDIHLGPLVMFGAGGVDVEWKNDVAFALAPTTRDEAESLLEATEAGRWLRGTRGLAPADREAVIDAIVRIAALAASIPEIQEIDINPLLAYGEGRGVQAVDVRIVRAITPSSPG